MRREAPDAKDAVTDLDARYGRTPAAKRTTRIIAIVAAVATALIVGSWVVWAGLAGDNGELQTRDIGYRVTDEHEVTIDFEVSVHTGTPLRCAVQALDTQKSIVGWSVIALPAADDFTTTHRAEVATTQTASTGLVYRCWAD